MEADLMLWVHGLSTPALDLIFVGSHYLGKGWVWAIVAVLAVGVHLLRGRRRAALTWLGVGLLTPLLVYGVKALVARPRPELWDRLVETGGYAFPSGHATAAATFLLLIAFDVHGRGHAAGIPLFVLAGVGLLFFGLGRIYLGVHWPSDVITGWVVGFAQALLAARLLRTPTVNGEATA